MMFHRTLVAAAVAYCLGGLALAAPTAFDIPAQPLAEAVKQLAKIAGITIAADSALMAGRSAPAVKGTMEPAQALRQLLSGSGLEAVTGAGGGFILQRAAVPPQTEQQLPEVKVQASAEARPDELPKPYAGGQVARGGSVGILGNRDMMETPFSQSNYTSRLMEDQHVRHIVDVLANDPTAHASASTATGADDMSIRGFIVENTEILFNGMPGIAPTFFNSMMSESIERVEVLKGPNAVLNGIAPGGAIGGTINLIPKRAGADPLTQFTATWSQKSQFGGHLDVSRRFGEGKEFGVRVNAAYREGDALIDFQSRKSSLLAAALDYQGERLRVFADGGYQEQNLKGLTDFTSVLPGVRIPAAPDSRRNYDGPDDFSHPKVYYGTLRGEFDFTRELTAFAAVGRSDRKTKYSLTQRTIVNEAGDLSATFSDGGSDAMFATAKEIGLRGRFATGSVRHDVVVAYNELDREWRRTRNFAGPPRPTSNIYNPVFAPGFTEGMLPDPDNLGDFQEYESSSTVLADTLAFMDDRLLFTLGARYQKLDSNFIPFNFRFADDKTTPMLGLLFKPTPRVSLYTNYIEGLQEGATAPPGTANEGQGFPPFTSKQYEVGAKYDSGGLGATLALYQIAQPSGFIDPATNIFGVFGEQRHRGIDLNIFGEAARGMRLLGGAAYIDSELTGTQGGINQGNRGAAVPEWRFVLGGEWDTPFLEGLTLTGRVVHNASMYLDPANTQVVPSWTRLDLGARYRVGKSVVVRANLYNAFGKDYWDANSFGQLSLSEPRTFSLSATFNF